MSSAGQRLHTALERFFALQQHGDEEPFRTRLASLQHYQRTRLHRTHDDLFAQPATRPAAQFLLDEVYGGRDLLPVAQNIRRALPKALRILPERVMATSATVLEAAVLTQELDESLALALGSALDNGLTDTLYAGAYRQQQRAPERTTQLMLLGELGGHLDRYIRSRVIQTSFRLVRRPAYTAGLQALYDFLQHAFAALAPLPSIAALLDTLTARERVIMQRLLSAAPQPFDAPFETDPSTEKDYGGR